MVLTVDTIKINIFELRYIVVQPEGLIRVNMLIS